MAAFKLVHIYLMWIFLFSHGHGRELQTEHPATLNAFSLDLLLMVATALFTVSIQHHWLWDEYWRKNCYICCRQWVFLWKINCIIDAL